MIIFKLNEEFITLGQFLKATGHIGSGGEAKFFLLENAVFINNEPCSLRGKKIYDGDIVKYANTMYLIKYDQKTNT
jgi:ribosome-associated protein